MLSKISWQEFDSSIAFLLLIYYVAIIVLYYRKDILKWSTSGIQINSSNNSVAEKNSIEETPDKKETAAVKSKEAKINYGDVRELMEDLKTIFISSAEKKVMKQELILSIRNKLHNYRQLKGTEIEREIIGHIKNECKEKCALDLENEELENLWEL